MPKDRRIADYDSDLLVLVDCVNAFNKQGLLSFETRLRLLEFLVEKMLTPNFYITKK